MFPIFFLLISNVNAQQPDTCAMVARTLHSVVANQLLHQEARGSKFTSKKRKEIVDRRVVDSTKATLNYQFRNSAIKGVESNMFAREPMFFTAYRGHKENNPCDNMSNSLRDRILTLRTDLDKQ